MDVLKTLGTRLLNGWQLSRLSTFEVAARHESFALAADELALTPSAVSHRINQLEEELGIQLFVRSHRKVELTREGKRVYWALKASLDGLNQEILDIITDEVAAYFAGDKDVQTTASMIQSRVNLYVQEQR